MVNYCLFNKAFQLLALQVKIILTNEKNFLKTISQLEFDYALFKKLLRIIIAQDFLLSSLKVKSYPTSLGKVCILT